MLSCIVAISSNNVIGKNNKIPWHIKEDLLYFKKVTLNHKIIMGRKTFESLKKVLPEREHIVITRNPDFFVNDKNVKIESDLKKVLEKYKNCQEEVFIIGGGDIYKESFKYIDKLYITKILKDFDGDTYFQNIDYDRFKLISESEKYINKESLIEFYFEVYEKIN